MLFIRAYGKIFRAFALLKASKMIETHALMHNLGIWLLIKFEKIPHLK